jgi:hypothetical protein
MATVEHPRSAPPARSAGAPSAPGFDAQPAGTPFRLFRRGLLAVPSWLVSMLVHLLLLLVLGLVTFSDPETRSNLLTMANVPENENELDQFTLEEVELGEMPEDFSEDSVAVSSSVEAIEPVPVEQPMEILAVAPEMPNLVEAIAPTTSTLQTLDAAMTGAMSSRSGDVRKQMVKKYGGTDKSEAAVARALRWLALHQMPNGGWTFAHSMVCRGQCDHPGEPGRVQAVNAATAMALLPFLGAGQTHMEGQYRETVRRGLMFLVQNGKAVNRGGLPTLDLTESGGNLYSHGLAAIALCEAYAMTQDPALAAPAQASLNYIMYAQDPRGGGWRYSPNQSPGDTSVTGWQVMALKSGHMGHLAVPMPVFAKSMFFLDTVQYDDGARYRYLPTSSPGGGGHEPCHPIGLLCRMYMGWDRNHPAIQAGVKYLGERGVDKRDIYYNYYAAQVLRHTGGSEWEAFNEELRDWLVDSQVDKGHAAGSWHFPDSAGHRGPKEGGRLASTSLATMILEVYYRHMPLYADSAAGDEDFPL